MPRKPKQGYINYKFRKFDLRKITRDSRCVFIGKSGSGKTVLLTDVMYQHRDIPSGICITATQDGREAFAKNIPEMYIFSDYDKNIIQAIIDKQEKSIEIKGKKDTPNTFIIMDDCLYDGGTWSKDPQMKWIFFNSRHDKILFLLTMQYPLGLTSNFRTNIDYTFILRENNLMNRERIFKNFAGMFPSFDVFCHVMDNCTSNYECLVIDNRTISNEIEDQVFWYKAELHEDFKVGSPSYWNTHYKYFKKTSKFGTKPEDTYHYNEQHEDQVYHQHELEEDPDIKKISYNR